MSLGPNRRIFFLAVPLSSPVCVSEFCWKCREFGSKPIQLTREPRQECSQLCGGPTHHQPNTCGERKSLGFSGSNIGHKLKMFSRLPHEVQSWDVVLCFLWEPIALECFSNLMKHQHVLQATGAEQVVWFVWRGKRPSIQFKRTVPEIFVLNTPEKKNKVNKVHVAFHWRGLTGAPRSPQRIYPWIYTTAANKCYVRDSCRKQWSCVPVQT